MLQMWPTLKSGRFVGYSEIQKKGQRRRETVKNSKRADRPMAEIVAAAVGNRPLQGRTFFHSVDQFTQNGRTVKFAFPYD